LLLCTFPRRNCSTVSGYFSVRWSSSMVAGYFLCDGAVAGYFRCDGTVPS
jgi:hypothetical protein